MVTPKVGDAFKSRGGGSLCIVSLGKVVVSAPSVATLDTDTGLAPYMGTEDTGQRLRECKDPSQERKAIIRERLDALDKLTEPVHGGKVRKWKGKGDRNGRIRKGYGDRRLI